MVIMRVINAYWCELDLRPLSQTRVRIVSRSKIILFCRVSRHLDCTLNAERFKKKKWMMEDQAVRICLDVHRRSAFLPLTSRSG